MIGVVNWPPNCWNSEMRSPLSVTREPVLAPVEKIVASLVGLNAETSNWGVMVPLTLLPRSTVNVCRADPTRVSLKEIPLAELIAATLVTVRLPRLTTTAPVRPVLMPPSTSVPGPVLVKLPDKLELMTKLLELY